MMICVIPEERLFYLDVERMIDEVCSKNEELIYIFEYQDVYTYGSSVSREQIAPSKINNIDVFSSKRGGLWTCHNSGQIVCYFVLNIKDWFARLQESFNLSLVIYNLEDIVIKVLRDYKVSAFRLEREGRGLWVLDQNVMNKISFLGLRFSASKMIYGFSINYSNNLDVFNFIKPCNITTGVTSVQSLYNSYGEILPDINLFKETVMYYAKLFYEGRGCFRSIP